MLKKITIILAAAICLVLTANLFAQDDQNEQKAPPQRQRVQRPQMRESQERPFPQREGLPPIVQQQPRRLAGTRKQVPQRPDQLQNQPVRPLAQAFDRWFDSVKKAYRENDTEKLGNLIRRMEQLRNQAPLAERPGQARLWARGAQQQRRLRQQGLRPQGKRGPMGQGRGFARQQRWLQPQGNFGPIGQRGPMGEGRGFGRQQRWLQPQGNFGPMDQRGPMGEGGGFGQQERWLQPQGNLGPMGQRGPMGEGRGFGQWPGRLGPENLPQITGPQREQLRQQRRLQRQNRQAPPDTPQTEEEFDWDW